MRVRLSDIAKMANVSIATASYVLNGKAADRGISEATAQRILELAQEHGFVLNRTAGFLQKGRYHLIAVIAPRCADFMLDMLQEIQQEGEKRDYQFIYSSTFDSIEREKTYLKGLIARRVDGVIMLPVDIHAPHLRYLTRNHVPTIFWRRRADSQSSHKFMAFADSKGGYMAARHLIDQGCRRIAFCSNPAVLDLEYLRIIHEARLEGCMRALNEEGLRAVLPRGLLVDPREPEQGALLAEQMRSRRIDGLVGFSDDHIAQVMSLLRREGIRIPDDVRMIGFDDAAFDVFLDPPLSSIGLPKADLGRSMVEALLRMIETGEHETDEVLLDPYLVARESSAGRIQEKTGDSRPRAAGPDSEKARTKGTVV